MRRAVRKNKDLTRLATMFGLTQFCYAEKPSGVEPGFRALDLDRPFFSVLTTLLSPERLAQEPQLSPEDKEDFLELKQDLDGETEDSFCQQQLERKQMLFAQFISDKKNSPSKKDERTPALQWLCTELKEAVARHNLKAWLYKFDYAEGQKERIKTNKEALREYLGTYLAHLFSEQNQYQELLWLKNGDKDCHALLACAWKNGLSTLSPFLHGGSEPDYNGILVKDKNATIKRAKLIPGLGKNLILGLALADRDGIGKEAQNKGFADGAFFGFDYGKAYEGSEVCSRLQDDFSFDDYYAKTPSIFRGSSMFGLARHWMYRNYSVFYDSSLAERMLGFHLLRKMISGESPSEAVSASYPELATELSRIEDRTPSKASLLGQLAELKNLCSPEQEAFLASIKMYSEALAEGQNSPFALYFTKIKIDLLASAIQQGMPYEELSDYLKFLSELLTKAEESNRHILAVFKQRALLSKTEIDLIEHLEKYFSPTSALSVDGQVFLNTLRPTPASSKISFQLHKEEDGSALLTTPDKKLLEELKEKLGLNFSLKEDQLSCPLKACELPSLMDLANKLYQQKREELISEQLNLLMQDNPALSACL